MKLLIWNKVGDKEEFKLEELKEIEFDRNGVIVTHKTGGYQFFDGWAGTIKLDSE